MVRTRLLTIPCGLNEVSRGLPREYPGTRAMRRGSGFCEMGNVSSLGALKPTPIGSAAKTVAALFSHQRSLGSSVFVS
jgi:hypothetical protein